MKIDESCYGVLLHEQKICSVRRFFLRRKLKRLGFRKNDPMFIRLYGLEDIENCEAWSRPLMAQRGVFPVKVKTKRGKK